MQDIVYVKGETRGEALERLEALGLSGDACAAVLAAGASHRHAHRVETVVQGLLASVGLDGVTGFYQVRVVAAALIVADVVGIGGGLFGNGCGTARHRHCEFGKGRKAATDGGAWDAALGDAFQALLASAQASGLVLSPYWDAEEAEWWLTARLERYESPVDGSSVGGTVSLAYEDVTGWIDREWQANLALAALGVRQTRLPYQVRFEGTPQEWGDFYNVLRAAATAAPVAAETPDVTAIPDPAAPAILEHVLPVSAGVE